MNKKIHYCWFGGKPLPKLAKRCIKSWKKFLPDYEIIEWNEKNFDVNITDFSKAAYENKKWAFVSDVARVYALKKYGGIYFDTDMLITKNVDFLLENDFFAGWESKDFVAVGVMGAKKPNNPIINEMFEKYKKLVFNLNDMYSLAIPKILTKILKDKYGMKNKHMENQKLRNNTFIYARDYFYPLSYDRKNNIFTENTCMIHYYDASWVPIGERVAGKLNRIFGPKVARNIVRSLSFIKRGGKGVLRIALYPYVYYRKKTKNSQNYKKQEQRFLRDLNNVKNQDYVVLYNPDWLGTTYATKELFDSILPLEEVQCEKYSIKVVEELANSNFKLVVFSALAKGWSDIARKLKAKKEDVSIKIIWHGSNSMHIEEYDWDRFSEMFKLYNDGIIDSLCFVKKSMADFYKQKGYRTEFLMNNVHIDNINIKSDKKDYEGIKIGIYASGDRWVKNFYNQLCATSLFEKAIVDCVPTSQKVFDFAELLDLNVSGNIESLPREQLFYRMAENDLNMYVTFTECAPLLPLESFELGVPCITGNNHHYWEDSELSKYIIVDETDDVLKIYERMKYCLDNKEKVMNLYRKWKKEYDKQQHVNKQRFLEIKK